MSKMTLQMKRNIRKTFLYVIYILLSFIFIFPLVYMIVSSFKSDGYVQYFGIYTEGRTVHPELYRCFSKAGLYPILLQFHYCISLCSVYRNPDQCHAWICDRHDEFPLEEIAAVLYPGVYDRSQ